MKRKPTIDPEQLAADFSDSDPDVLERRGQIRVQERQDWREAHRVGREHDAFIVKMVALGSAALLAAWGITNYNRAHSPEPARGPTVPAHVSNETP